MEEIKIRRYKIRNDFCMCGKPKGFIGDITKGEWVKYSDHKAVVETMKQDHENKIYHKDTEVNLAHGECEQLRLKVSEMQNKIDELTAEKNKTKAEHFNVMRILSDENKTEMEISMLEQMADDWMNNWIAK